MGICYHCGKELDEQSRCKLCNLTFCSEHLAPEAHNSIALSKDFKVKKGQEKTQKAPPVGLETVEGEEEPVEGVRKGINYLPVEDEEAIVKEVKRRKEPSGGVNRARVLLFLIIIAIGMWSINVLVSMSQTSGSGNLSPITFPTDEETQVLRASVLEKMNQERSKSELPALSLSTDLTAQRYSETLASTDAFQYNPSLPSGIKENIVRRDMSTPFSAENTIIQTVAAMMTDDSANNWVNRDAILNRDYAKVSIGVCWNSKYFYIVQDFSR